VTVSAGWLGFLIVVLLGVATLLLIRNMNMRLKRLPDRFPSEPPEDADEDASGPSAGA
jgi:hypothetical protein